MKIKQSIGKWFYDKRLYFLVFAIPFAIMYVVYAVFGVHPYGDESVLVLDLNGQYVYYYEAFRDAFYGDGSFIYNWSRNLSGEMFGIFAYYLASPFMLIPILLPRSMMCGSVLLMQLAKIGTCAVTFAYYIKNAKKAKTLSVILFSTTYALMTYVVVELMNPMWIDALVYLPLIVYGAEKLIDKGRMLPFIIPLALMFIAHFYIGYMVAIFMIFYFPFYACSQEGRVFRKNIIERAAKYFLSAVIAVGVAAFVIIPVYNSLKLGKLDFTDPDFSLATQFDIWQFVSKLFPFTYDTVRPEGMPMLGAGTIIILLLPLFFLNQKITMKEKVSHVIMCAILFILMYVRPADMAMHGFQVPNWLPYRYSFMFTFLVILMALRAFENLDGVSTKELGVTFFGILVLVFVIEDKDYDYFKTMKEAWGIIICLCILYAALHLFRKYHNRAAAVVLCALVCVEIAANSLHTIYAVDWDVNYSKFSSYQDYMADGRDVVDYVEEHDDGLFRMEKTFYRTVNDPIGMGYYGLSHSSSTMNTPVLDLLKNLGIGHGGHSTRYLNATMVTDSIFGIKYMMYKDQEIWNDTIYNEYPMLYSPDDTGIADIYVHENPYALSIGFAADDAVLELAVDNANPFENQADLLNTLAYGEESESWLEYFHPIEYIDYIPENITTTQVVGNHTKYEPNVKGKNAQLEFIFEHTGNYPMYMFLETTYERRANVWVDNVFNNYYFEGEYYSIQNLGEHEAGSQMSLILTLTKDDLYIRNNGRFFNYLYPHELEQTVDVLREGEWNLTEHTETYLKGDITVKEGQVMFTTIPYEEGWTVTVDGKEVKPLKALNCLIAIPLTAGTHTVTMKFMPDYFVTGILISLISVLLVVFIGIIQYKDGALMYKLFAKKSKAQKTSEPVEEKAQDTPTEPTVMIEQIEQIIQDEEQNE